jgi:hypothetical protein
MSESAMQTIETVGEEEGERTFESKPTALSRTLQEQATTVGEEAAAVPPGVEPTGQASPTGEAEAGAQATTDVNGDGETNDADQRLIQNAMIIEKRVLDKYGEDAWKNPGLIRDPNHRKKAGQARALLAKIDRGQPLR